MTEGVTFESLYAGPSRNGLTRPKRVRGTGYKMINMGELFAHDRIKNPPMDLVPMSDDEIERFGVRAGDLLFARQSLVAEGAGKCSIALSVPEITTFESHLIRVRLDPKLADPLFYFYYFSSPNGKANVQSLVMQVAAAGIRGSELARLKVPNPHLDIQRRIASILSAYDDLIENNTQRIAILEEMARRIYEEWFVRFRFPGHENVRMAESELGPIPEGWGRVRLHELADVNARSIKRSTEPDEIVYVDISSVSTASINQRQRMPFSGAPGRARRLVRDGDVIWACVRPNRKSYAAIIDPEPDLVVSTGFAVLSATKVPWSYLYRAVTTEDFVAYLVNHAKGAAYPAVGAEDFENALVLKPNNQVLTLFNEIAEPMMRLAETLARKNANLRTTRDLLLPKLISGELDVSNLSEPEAAA